MCAGRPFVQAAERTGACALDAVRVVTVVGTVRQTAGRRRAIAVALGTGAGGRGAIGVVRVATRTGLMATLRRAGAG